MSRHAPDESVYSSLTLGRLYDVLGIEADWYRLLNDRHEPVLYDPACFHVVETDEPVNWVSEFAEGVRYAYPVDWGRRGFFEDWHDGVSIVREAFNRQLRQWHPQINKRA